MLRGDKGDDLLGGGDSNDVLFGGAGADAFVFGAEANNGLRERDIVVDFEIGVDSLVLEDGAAVSRIRETASTVIVFLEGDGDAIFVRGEGITAGALNIVTNDPSFDLV